MKIFTNLNAITFLSVLALTSSLSTNYAFANTADEKGSATTTQAEYNDPLAFMEDFLKLEVEKDAYGNPLRDKEGKELLAVAKDAEGKVRLDPKTKKPLKVLAVKPEKPINYWLRQMLYLFKNDKDLLPLVAEIQRAAPQRNANVIVGLFIKYQAKFSPALRDYVVHKGFAQITDALTLRLAVTK